ncbi:MAG: putative ABC transporter permease [Clostridiales bacterium]|nr:putative ABC transporter permease [Clostridiales bacterium]
MVLYDTILWFFIYSIYGWCYETIYCSIEAGEFVKRGFFYGPYLPIYGFGAIFVIILLHKQMSKPKQFLLSMVVTTALEYTASWLLEIIFHKTWWDYTNYNIQLNGRICLLGSLLFGFLGVVLINYIQPRVKHFTDRFSKSLKVKIAGSAILILLTDFVFSVIRAFR